MTHESVTVTVAICTWNRCDLLEKTLEQMTRLREPSDARWELLVVDNNCTDRTAAILRAFGNRLPLRVVHEERPGLSNARNRALAETSSDLILWTDDDVLVDEQWLCEFVAAARKHPEAAGFGGPIEPWFLDAPDPELCAAFPALATGYCAIERDAAAGPVTDDHPIWGANMGFRRREIEGLAFKTHLGPTPTSPAGGDEVEFRRQLRARGGTMVWWPQMRLKHCVSSTRATLQYLRDYTFAKGREQVQLNSGPDSGRRLTFRGAPLWLWREWMLSILSECASRVGLSPRLKRLRSGPQADASVSAAVRALVCLRERLFIEGMIAECRRARDGQATSGGAGQSVQQA